MRPNDHFPVLDGLRGVAALSVMVMHAGVMFGAPMAQHSYLAVDFFFWLSGFVVARAYGYKLACGMSVWRFALIRLVRLYPMVLAGVALGGGYLLAKAFLHAGPPPTDVLTSIAAALVLWPSLPSRVWVVAYPANGNLWSLAFEVWCNLGYAGLVKAHARWVLWPLVFAGCAAMAGVVAIYGTMDFGVAGRSFWLGAPRAVLGLAGGALLCHLVEGPRRPDLPRLPMWVSAAVLIVIFAVPKGWASAGLDLTCVVLIFPVLTALSAHPVSDARVRRACQVLGELSYPLYVVHQPVFMWLASLFFSARLTGRVAPLGLAMTGCLVALAASAALLMLYDAPLRRWIRPHVGDRKGLTTNPRIQPA